MLLVDRPQDFGPAKRTLLRLPYAGSIRGADTLICVSRATRDRLTAFDGRTTARSTAVPLATSPTLLTASPQAVEGLKDRPFALVVGDTQPRKNLPTVISAWREVVARQPDAVLVQVGPPPWGRSPTARTSHRCRPRGTCVSCRGSTTARCAGPTRTPPWCWRPAWPRASACRRPRPWTWAHRW
ncbi:hypothetical protein ACFQX8_19100 [Klenkia terrae]|uniref:hypothetical protein n=1 Tax=Klenkia terrae TaxID=1052259 RepID=UPI0036089304